MSWLDWLYNNQPKGDGLGAAPLPDLPSQLVPSPPSRPTTGLYDPRMVPTPPARPQSLMPQADPAFGDPMGAVPYDIPGLPNSQPMKLPPVLGPRNVPMPPSRPSSFALSQPPQPVQAPQTPRLADTPAVGARPASTAPVAPQGPAQAPQMPQAPAGYRYVLQPIDGEAPQGQPQGGQTAPQAGGSTPTIFGANVPPQGLLNAFMAPNAAPAAVGANGPEIPQPTGLAKALGAQPSMQAQNSTGPTAFLDSLFGFR